MRPLLRLAEFPLVSDALDRKGHHPPTRRRLHAQGNFVLRGLLPFSNSITAHSHQWRKVLFNFFGPLLLGRSCKFFLKTPPAFRCQTFRHALEISLLGSPEERLQRCFGSGKTGIGPRL